MPEEKPTTLLEALLKVQAEIPNLKLSKDALGQVAGNRKYRYMTLHKLHAEVLPLLSKHGLVWVTTPGKDNEGNPLLGYSLLSGRADVPGQIDGAVPLMLDKNNSQGLGSAITYARRYALCAVLGIVADEDDDGAKASEQATETMTIPKPIDGTKALMTQSQLQNMWKALGDADLEPKQLELILAASGIDSSTKDVTIQQGREIRRRLEAAQNGD